MSLQCWLIINATKSSHVFLPLISQNKCTNLKAVASMYRRPP